MITVSTEPGRYVITAPAGTKDRNPQLKAAVDEAKAMAALFGFTVEVVKGDRGVADDFQALEGDRSPSTTQENVEIADETKPAEPIR